MASRIDADLSNVHVNMHSDLFFIPHASNRFDPTTLDHDLRKSDASCVPPYLPRFFASPGKAAPLTQPTA